MEPIGLEGLQLEVIRVLCLLPRESLVELCDYLIIAGAEFEHVTNKSRTALITLISNHIQREELEKLEDQGMADLLHLQDKISEIRRLEEIEALPLQLLSTQKQDENNKPETSGIKDITPIRQSPQSVVHTCGRRTLSGRRQKDFKSFPWQKDFKIAGQIGEPGQKDKLTFSSLARQIEHGLSKGFPEL